MTQPAVVRSRVVCLALVLVGAASAGCLSVKSYVDPQLPKVTYGDLLRRSEPRPLHLALDFQTNGKPNARAQTMALERVVRVLDGSKLFSAVAVTPSGTLDRIEIVMNNVGDKGDAIAKGVGTGLTFGAAGSMVTDGYIFTATFRAVGKEPVQKVYRHALHSTIGNASGPPGLNPMSVQEAFDKVVEDLVLNFLLDLQKEERL